MTAPESITVTAGQLTDTLTLLHGTALNGCCELVAEHPIRIARRWPVLSSGEELLWRVLAWVNGGGDLPSDADLRAGLSSDQWPALNIVLANNGAVA